MQRSVGPSPTELCPGWRTLVPGPAPLPSAVLTSHRDAFALAPWSAGVALLLLGLVGLAAVLTWTLRDPHVHLCLVCGQPVSRWCFIGTYLPPAAGQAAAGKAHTAHVRCVLCETAVVLDRWAEAPLGRPWHERCWDRHCRAVTRDLDAWQAWVAAQGDRLSDVELVHMYAAALARDADPRVLQQLRLQPRLHNVPIAGREGRTVMHLAAAAGDVATVSLILEDSLLTAYEIVDRWRFMAPGPATRCTPRARRCLPLLLLSRLVLMHCPCLGIAAPDSSEGLRSDV